MRVAYGLVLVSLGFACSPQKGQILLGQSETGSEETGLGIDEDGDGVSAAEDCDDSDEGVYPGAEERCDGIDNNCDGQVDGADSVDATAWYTDSDGDGYGGADSEVLACEGPAGMITDGTDCNDQDVDYHPGAQEDDCADPNDYNCDGSVGHVDLDSDGFAACEDCDDAAVNVNSAAQEVCDGIDNDCDFLVDDSDASLDVSTASSWYVDSDLDGYGVSGTAVTACSAPAGTSGLDGDCDDGEPLSYPGAAEACDGLDNDCDGTVPASEVDGDGDGFLACDDCDDTDPAINPIAVEICDGVENNCDGLFLTGELTDQDLDGYLSCDDCDDTDSAVNASAVEDCGDGVDNDCDGLIDGQQLVCQVYAVDITSSSGSVDVASALGNPTTAVAVLVTIFPGVTVQSSSTSTPALTTAGLPAGSTVEVLNQGTIHGRGGNGACDEQGAGGHGGDAILMTVDVTIDNASGFIYGGGGGGGSSDDPTGGGGGAGGGAGCDGGQNASGGDGGAGPNRWGAIPGGQAANYDGSAGTGGAWGNPGSPGGGGSGGAAQSGPADWQEGQGGAGGGWGGGGGGGSGQNSDRNPGPGGDAGYAVRVQSGSLTWVAGYNTTQVKGLAQ